MPLLKPDLSRAIGIFGNQVATDLKRVSTNPADLDDAGWWAVTQSFEGEFLAFEFESVTTTDQMELPLLTGPGVLKSHWTPSLNSMQYQNGVTSIKEDIARGWVYQTNLCYVLTANLENQFDPIGLWQLLSQHNPAPYLSALYVPKNDSGLSVDIAITSASPELFLKREGNQLISSPIKGTAKTADQLLAKDHAENVMIVDLIRNDLSQIAIPGTVEVPELLRVEPHPGLVHLVSDVSGLIADDLSWVEILNAMSPAGSVSGAPKSSALEVISRLETVPRQIYCGGFGYVDANRKVAQLAVGIRTFWETENDGVRFLNFGTGAGITWDSDPVGEWNETELKAEHLLSIAQMQ